MEEMRSFAHKELVTLQSKRTIESDKYEKELQNFVEDNSQMKEKYALLLQKIESLQKQSRLESEEHETSVKRLQLQFKDQELQHKIEVEELKEYAQRLQQEKESLIEQIE